MSRRIRHATDASSITGGSSINGNLQEGQDETDGVIAGSILSNVSVHPTNNINWFRSEIQRLKFGKLNSHSTSLMRCMNGLTISSISHKLKILKHFYLLLLIFQ